MKQLNKEIKFSIMSPVYNVEKYFDACIKSVLNQTYKNYELILIDDGSTDSCGKKCDEYAEKYPQIKVYHKLNGGIMSARRYALEKIDGDYCIFLDPDDALYPNALETIYNYIVEYDCDCIVYARERVFEDKVLSRSDWEENAPLLISDKKELYKKVFFSSYYNVMWRKAVKRSVFQGWDFSPYFHISIGEDLLQSLEIYKNAKSFLFVNDCLYRYTLNLGSVTQKPKPDNYTPDFTVSEKVLKFIDEEGIFTDKDVNDFRDYNIRLLISELISITESFPDFKKQKELFKIIENSDYYKSFLSKGFKDTTELGSKKYIYYLFKNKNYKTLSILLKYRFKKITHQNRREI